jgi:hypothetical protein
MVIKLSLITLSYAEVSINLQIISIIRQTIMFGQAYFLRVKQDRCIDKYYKKRAFMNKKAA